MGDRAEDGQLDAVGVPEGAAGWGLNKIKPGVHRAAPANQDEDDELLHEMAQVDQELSWGRQLRPEAGENFAKYGHDLDQQENRN